MAASKKEANRTDEPKRERAEMEKGNRFWRGLGAFAKGIIGLVSLLLGFVLNLLKLAFGILIWVIGFCLAAFLILSIAFKLYSSGAGLASNPEWQGYLSEKVTQLRLWDEEQRKERQEAQAAWEQMRLQGEQSQSSSTTTP